MAAGKDSSQDFSIEAMLKQGLPKDLNDEKELKISSRTLQPPLMTRKLAFKSATKSCRTSKSLCLKLASRHMRRRSAKE